MSYSRRILTPTSSRLGLLLAALEAILRRFSRLAGSWAQQSPCGPLADSVQGSPFALVARQTAISGYPPPPLVLDQLDHGDGLPGDKRPGAAGVQYRPGRIDVEEGPVVSLSSPS